MPTAPTDDFVVSTTVVEQVPAKDSTIRSNPLTSYSSCRYTIELQGADYNSAKEYQKNFHYDPTKWTTFVSSAGGIPPVVADGKIWFGREYYIDDCEIESIVGPSPRAVAGIDVHVKFNIVEPHGIHFVQDLKNYFMDGLKYTNFFTSLIMLKITWKGFTDMGELVDNSETKLVPLVLTNIDIKLTGSGSQYVVEAVPINYTANAKQIGLLRGAVNLEGITLKDMTDQLQKALNDQMENSSKVMQTAGNDPSFSTTYKIVIDSDIMQKATMGDPLSKNVGITPTTHFETDYIKYMNNLGTTIDNLYSADKDKPKNTASFTNGEQIKVILKRLILSSSYITKQIADFRTKIQQANDPKKTEEQKKQELKNLEKSLDWFIISTKVEMPTSANSSATTGTNKPVVNVTYYISPYVIPDPRSGKDTLVPGKKPEIVKDYYYYFTGNNTDILRLDIDFKTSLYTYRNYGEGLRGTAGGKTPENADSTDKNLGGTVPGISNPTGAGITALLNPLTDQKGTQKVTLDQYNAHNLADILYSTVDLITINMEIMGDPDLIIQDTVSVDREKFFEFKKQGGIVFSEGEQYIGLHFKTPYDIPDNTGIADSALEADKLSNTTMFDGAYGLMTITSHFKQGKFTQNLSLRRVNDESLVTKNTSVTTKA